MFLTFEWQEEELCVAVIQAYRTTDWITGIPNSPQLLGSTDGSLLQVIEVHALDAVAGRIGVLRNGYKKTVIFETSGGILKADLLPTVAT